MARKTVCLLPSTQRALEKAGANIKKARLRRNIHAELLAERAGISTDTLSSIERGVPTVSIGAYASVLAVLEMDKDFEQIASDEKGKQKYQDSALYRRERATRDNRKEVCDEKKI